MVPMNRLLLPFRKQLLSIFLFENTPSTKRSFICSKTDLNSLEVKLYINYIAKRRKKSIFLGILIAIQVYLTIAAQSKKIAFIFRFGS